MVTAGENVIVTQSIVNSDITAEKRIVCSGGKHAAIIGGRYRACEEINAKTIGSPTGGAETILEVGSDPKSKARMDELDVKLKHAEAARRARQEHQYAQRDETAAQDPA